MLRALLSLGNEHVLRPFDLELVRRSRVPGQVDDAPQPARRIAFFHPPKCGGTSVRRWLASEFGRLHVLPVALAFLKAFPEVDLRLSLVDRVVDMIEEGIDVALRIAHLADSSLIAARVGAVKLVTCAAPAYLKANGSPRAPGELIQHHCIAAANFSAAAMQ